MLSEWSVQVYHLIITIPELYERPPTNSKVFKALKTILFYDFSSVDQLALTTLTLAPHGELLFIQPKPPLRLEEALGTADQDEHICQKRGHRFFWMMVSSL